MSKRKDSGIKYGVRDGARVKGDPQAIGEAITKLHARDGGISPEAVINDARPEKSPMHKEFTWSDAVAGAAWRIHEAQHLIRSVSIIVTEPDESVREVRAFIGIPAAETSKGDEDTGERTERSNGRRTYYPRVSIMSDEEKHQAAVCEALRDLDASYRRYHELIELKGVWEAIERAKKMVRVRSGGATATAD